MNIVSNANYYELFFCQGEKILNSDNNDLELNIGLSEKRFYEILYRIDPTQNKNLKYFQREYKEYILKDIECHCFVNDEVKVMKKKPLCVTKNSNNNFVQIAYNKTKLTLVNFDSTKNLHKISYVKKLIFRVSNRIYINFEISIAPKLASPSSLCSQNQETLETLEKNPMKCERSERHVVAMGAIDSETKKKNYKIYINYNHDDNVDINISNKSIDEIITMIKD
jgi:hypothetical protein